MKTIYKVGTTLNENNRNTVYESMKIVVRK